MLRKDLQLRLQWFSLLFVCLWQSLVLTSANIRPSLMAHDEGWYVTLALGMVKSGDWLSPRWWGALMYDKTSGLHWLIAIAFSSLGVNETVARLPSFIACVACVGLTYAIGRRLISQPAALLGALCLSTSLLWNQYGQLATQDIPMTAVELTVLWALLQAEAFPNHRYCWGMLAGLGLGIGFFVKGFMVVLPACALLPYLIWNQRRHKHLTNWGLYAGVLTGSVLVLVWLFRLWQLHGSAPWQQLFGILALAAGTDYHKVGPLYYLWNIPVNFLPWSPLAVVGGWQLFRHNQISNKLMLLGYPLLLLLALQIFPTKTPYYPLQIYPFLALFSGYVLAKTCQSTLKPRSQNQRATRIISYSYGTFGVLILGLCLFLLLKQFNLIPLNKLNTLDYLPYVPAAFALGISWLVMGSRGIKPRVSPRAWLASLLIGPWLAFILTGFMGLYGNYSPSMKAFVTQPVVAALLQQETVQFVLPSSPLGRDHQTWILASFYTPHWGQLYQSTEQLAPGMTAWLSPVARPMLKAPHQSLGVVRNWELVKLTNAKEIPKIGP